MKLRSSRIAVVLFVFVVLTALDMAHGVSAQETPVNTGKIERAPDAVLRYASRVRHLEKLRTDPEYARRVSAPGEDEELGGANESVIAVNPLNSQNVVYASLYQLRVSNDGGRSFEPDRPFLAPPGYVTLGDPSVAFDSQGRLFSTVIGSVLFGDLEMFVYQHDPATGAILEGYPVIVQATAGSGVCDDKQWLAADSWPGSPYRDRLYMVWADTGNTCGPVSSRVFVSYSQDQGLTWSTRQVLSGPNNWPMHIAVGPEGDVYVASHNSSANAVEFWHSADGGQTFQSRVRAFGGGQARVNDGYPPAFPGVRFWTQGSRQPWVLPDPITPGKVTVVSSHAADFPEIHVYVAQTLDDGQSWSVPRRVDTSTSGVQFFPTASVDRTSGDIIVAWYDTRAGEVNDDGYLLLDTYATYSVDGGATFTSEFAINDRKFDPDLNAPCRYECPPTFQAVWSGGPDEAWVVAPDSPPYRWDGATWAPVPGGGVRETYGVWGASSDSVWVAGDSGIWLYDGSSWSAQYGDPSFWVNDLEGSSSDAIYAPCSNGFVLAWDGSSWSILPSTTSVILYGITVISDDLFWVCGEDGTVLRYDGTTWADRSPNTDELIWDVWARADDDVWAVGANGGIYRWNGVDWSFTQSRAAGLSGVWGSSENDVYFSGTGEFLLRWNGSDFEEISADFYLRRITGTSATSIFGAGIFGRVADFDGTTWRRQEIGVTGQNITKRIGEYIGVSLADGVGITVWTGNTTEDDITPAQQTLLGRFVTHPTSVGEIEEIVAIPLLGASSPNPFRWVTRISFSQPEALPVRLAVFDARGRRVRTLDQGVPSVGWHEVTWDARDDGGRRVADGVYFVTMERAGEVVDARKVSLVR